MTSKIIQGVLPVFQTPFLDDGSEAIDFETLEREIHFLFDRGADGVVMGMVSETLRLSHEERKALAKAVCQFARGRGTSIISAGAESSKVAVEFAQHAESVGADAVMVIPPVSVAVGEDELRRYYERIIQAIQIPVVVQDASGYVGRPMSIAMQAELFNTYGPRVLFKPEATPLGPRLTALHEATHGKATIFEGSGGIALVDNYRRGVAGTMPGADLIDTLVALWKALKANDTPKIDALSLPLTAMNAMLHSLDAYLAIEKYLLVKQGIFKNQVVRGPIGFSLDDETRNEVDRLYGILNKVLAAG